MLLLAAVAMAVVLIRLRERAEDRIAGGYRDAGPVSELVMPPATPAETVTLVEANDAEGAVSPVERKLPLPTETGARARVLLRRLFEDYAAPESKHPLAAGPGVEQVFFMGGPSETQIAVVNLTAAFAENHPSGIEAETLTLLSIIGTLRENFPAVGRVRFLVDGRPRETLAGHADLSRSYAAGSEGVEP
jgi:hypothetical protein